MSDKERIEAVFSLKDEFIALKAKAIASGCEVHGTVIITARDKNNPGKLLQTAVAQIQTS